MQRKLGERVGLAPGADMRTAIIAAKKANIQVVLIDQPIQQTLTNLSQMKFSERAKFILYLLAAIILPVSILPASAGGEKIDLTKVPEEKLIERLSLDLKKKFPTVYSVLVEDRNKYMSNQLIKLQQLHPDAEILVVVGAGHVKGITAFLGRKDFFKGKL